ncbi:DUF2058 family protein [Silanimonas sp.]|uniref:DUF2058 domain-containing protein n=1 Tax=Silanimonas sp. TaxID=1929290 RepID=UPI001BB8FFEA|nr:DUF2058 family protein [Silanimonas sp.]MBS3896634.1 DUF2058 family protein [Silanimonas sp.]MBS3924243.1 DUF2058 family protein [Xanthomonadaceae bacterium]
MSDSLKDQLLGLGFKPAPKPERSVRKPEPKRPQAPPAGPHPPTSKTPQRGGKPRTQEEIDLGKAYALRAETEKRERIAAEQAKQDAARLRREAKARLDAFLVGKALNDPAAEHARHFPYGGKIKRVHVTPEQLKALNAGELGVLQSHGRYLLVSAAVLAEAKAIFPEAVALEVDPSAPPPAEAYDDPQFQIPDDLVW